MLESLKDQITEANRELGRAGLIRLTWGSVSGIDRQLGLIAITPVGVSHERLNPQDNIVINLGGKIVQKGLGQPSPDVGVHLELYRCFQWIGGVTHTHSAYATMFAQARQEIPYLGTMQADYFGRAIPLTRELTAREIADAPGRNTGKVIVEKMPQDDSVATPGVLVPRDGPFAWGRDAMASVNNAKALEAIAEIAFGACLLSSYRGSLSADRPAGGPG